MRFQRYSDQLEYWPTSGRHILAQFDEENIIVYQAYRSSIGRYAIGNQFFGGDFNFNRMSWIKPNFLWMMYRSGWGIKEGQEFILAVTIRRSFFDEILTVAVPSTFNQELFSTEKEWKDALAGSEVRLQWDPDHTPSGSSCNRRAIQLGLRGEMLQRYAETEVVRIRDLSAFVDCERKHISPTCEDLTVPEERIYTPSLALAAQRVGLDRSIPDSKISARHES